MENFFNYITKPLKPEDIDIWFKMNNIILEKMELYSDFCHTLYILIYDTYLGQNDVSTETKIKLSDDDNLKHFQWCWLKVVDDFKKENIDFNKKGEHFDYFYSFFDEIFYTQIEDKIKNSINSFFIDLFNTKKTFTKSDLDMVLTIYKILDKNLKK
jgi:hypothetical protein